MSPVVNLAIYLVAGTVGGFIGAKTRFPAATILGAVLAVVIVKSVAGNSWSTPKSFNFVSQVILGVLIALAYSPGMFKGMGMIALPMLGSTLALVLAGTGLAVLFWRLGYMDLATAYIATSPGGMSVLVPMAVDMEVNVPLIAAFHFFRVIAIVATAPLVFRLLLLLH